MTDKQSKQSVPTTGHSWDGITELDNPCPRWWLISLYLSVLFVVVYFVLYPSLPLLEGSTKGLLGWTQIKEYKEDLAEIEKVRAPFEQQLSKLDAETVLTDPQMLNYVITTSRVLFGDNCVGCHGVGGVPEKGTAYPVLADDEWLFGGTINDIMLSIAGGRAGVMLGQSDAMTEQQVAVLSQFIIDIADGGNMNTAAKGKALYLEHGCATCHGDDAKGNKHFGAPDLTDSVWRFSSDFKAIQHTILHGVNDPSDPDTRIAVMPKWNEKLATQLETRQKAIEEGKDPDESGWRNELTGDEVIRLSENDIKKLTIYVHQFGGGVPLADNE